MTTPKPSWIGPTLAIFLACRLACAAEPLPTVSFVEAWAPGDETTLAPVSAIGIRGPERPAEETVRTVILVDTSASQSGVHRRRQLDAVCGLLSAARPDDRFAVAAVDVDCVPLAEGFHAAEGSEIREAVIALEARTPLGTTDFAAALAAAVDLFDDSTAARRIVYVGDGPALAALDPEEFHESVQTLHARRVSLFGLGVGEQVNWPCLAATANATGGSLLVPEPEQSARASGAELAKRLFERVTWPAETLITATVPDAPLRMLPGWLPPLRADRDSVVLVYGPLRGGRMEIVSDDGELEDGRRSAVLEIPVVEPREDNAYLVELARNAWSTGGLFLPTLGREGLDLAAAVIRGEAATLATLSRQARAIGADASAVRLAEASLRRDPDNEEAAVVREAVLARTAQAPGDPGGPDPALPPARVDLPAGDARDLQADVDLRRAASQALEREIAVRIREARLLLVAEPDRARDQLKNAEEQVRGAVDLDPATRDRLLRQLESRIRESVNRSREKVDRDLAAERRAAIGRERLRLTAELQRREERFTQLVDRYNSLVEEGIRIAYAQPEYYPEMVGKEAVIGVETPSRNFLLAERGEGEEMGKQAPELWANHPMPMTARVVARTAPLVARILHYDAQNHRTRRDQERGFMDAMHEVDVAAIPFPSEPPIVYPTAERWRELTELRKKWKSVDLIGSSDNEKKIYNALEGQVSQTFDFQETPLRAALTQLADAYDIPIVPDVRALDEAGLDLEATTVTQKLSGGRLRSGLRLLLRQNDLTYIVRDDVLLITTKDEAEKPENMVRKVYPVADLVIPLNAAGGVNPFAQGGGMGGAGGMGGGMGGMGAGMGGMGGMGAGMGGMGGFCWVAREVYGAHDPRWLVFRRWMTEEAPSWFRSFYERHGESLAEWLRGQPGVKALVRSWMDTIVEPRFAAPAVLAGQWQVSEARARLARRDDAAVRAGAEPGPGSGPSRVDAGRVGLPDEVLGAADLRAALAGYLPPVGSEHAAAADPREMAARIAQVRVTAADLGRQRRFEQAVDLIQAAISAGYPEPWMYESLAVALEAAGRSRAEIERVLLSSADFSTSASDLLHLAYYLARVGADRHAVRVCRQVTRIDPLNREAYALAMTVAARSDDEAGLRWSCPGVLAQEWPAGQRDIAIRAARLSKAAIERLAAAGKKAESDAFRTAVEQALVRDLVIEVSWTGDADVDIAVQEPPGTICSRSAPRSSAGGQLQADENCAAAGGAGRAQAERYAATEAFPGTYTVAVRRVTGRVTADTITVEMTLFRGTDREQRLKRQVPVTADEQFLSVDVPWGRRQQPVLDAQIAEDVNVQQQIGKAALANQLAALADPGTVASLSQSRSGLADEGSSSTPRGAELPFFRAAGAAGYQPVVTQLPEGLNLRAQAIVSADRRYVRSVVEPLFSGVGQVTQFNFAGGGAQGATGGMGGGGMGGGGMGGGGMGGMGGGGMGGMGGGGMGGMGGGGMGGMGGGGMGGGGMGGFCWVAREVYGSDSPRWLLFRAWLLSADAPGWLRGLYAAHGEAFATWIHDKPAIKAGVRALMDAAIDAAAERTATPCPASE